MCFSCLAFRTSAFDDDVLRRCPNTTINSSGLSRWAGHQPKYQRTVSDQLHQLKDEARAIERRLREALAAVAEQEAIMRADEGEKHRAELRRQEYSKQWTKDDDKLRSLERSVQVFAPKSCVSLAHHRHPYATFPYLSNSSMSSGCSHSSDKI